MTYTKTVWETGDTITAQKLNNMENGIARLFECSIESDEYGNFTELSCTTQEIIDNINDGGLLFAIFDPYPEDANRSVSVWLLSSAGISENNYTFDFVSLQGIGGDGAKESFTSTELSAKPEYNIGGGPIS